MAGRLRLARAPKVVVAPMLASTLTAGARMPEGPAWIFEPKLDGVRAIAVISPDGGVSLISRNGIDKAAQFPEIAEALAGFPQAMGVALREPVILDGEIVALNEQGAPARFQSLQGRMHASRDVDRLRRSRPSAYVVFDCLSDGSGVGGVGDTPLISLPWRHRRRRLEGLLARVATRSSGANIEQVVRLGEASSDGEAMLEEARANGWEGLIAKRVGAPYVSGQRTRDWLKIKIEGRQEFVIGGWTDPENSRPGLGALLLGVYEPDGTLRYAGKVGTGFNHTQLRELRATLGKLHRATSPFASVPARFRGPGVHWVKPELVAEVKYTEWTADGHLRHPSFQGLRDDKDARSVVREPPSAVATKKPPVRAEPVTDREAPAARETSNNVLGPPPLRLLTRLQEIEDSPKGSGILTLPGGGTISLTSLSRAIIAASRSRKTPAITKGELLRYYVRVAPVLLPAIADRPLVLKRYHGSGKQGESFYQQHAPTTVPAGVRTARVDQDLEASSEQVEKPRFIAGNLETLLYIVQLGAVSIDPWHSRLDTDSPARDGVVPSIDTPDYTIIDLDPGPGVKFDAVIECARWVREELDRLGLNAIPKTSGASGMHVVLPLPPGVGWDAARLLAELVATRVAQRHPKQATVVRAVRARPRGTIYVDYLQNIRGKTVAGVYSARAVPGATVSTPLEWSEVDRGLDPRDFTIENVPDRIADVGDVWGDGMRRGNTLERLLAVTDPGAASRSRPKTRS
jgi:bifunctional non-homologous end joining protein LigD